MATSKQATVVSEEADIISSLPEELLSHIISSLPFKEAIKTSVLSTRWTKIWTSICKLNLDLEDDFSSRESFMKVLLNHTGTVDTLKIPCRDDDFGCIQLIVLRKKVRELDLLIDLCMDKLLDGVFTCNTLEVLKLHLRNKKFMLKSPSSKICLPSLKCVHLYFIRISCDDDAFQSLLSSSSVLEELEIFHCEILTTCEFSAPTLKRLTIDILSGQDFEIKIDAPSLVYFRCCNIRQRLLLKNLSTSLVEVWMDIGSIEYLVNISKDFDTNNVGLFEGIGHVQSLHLSGILTETHWNGYSYVGWKRLLVDLLSCFPSLKALELNLNYWCSGGGASSPPSGKRLPPQLKTHKILSFKGFGIEMEVILFFLRSAQLLEECTVEIARKTLRSESKIAKKALRSESEVTQEVLKLQKFQKNCKILVV